MLNSIKPYCIKRLEELKKYIETENMDAALATTQQILDSIERLTVLPEIGRSFRFQTKEGQMRYLVGGKYLIFYTFKDSVVTIYRILYGKRNYKRLLEDLP